MRIKEYQNGIIGQNLKILSEITSTNDYLKDRLSKSEPFREGSVILAVHQTKGRGQREADWKSEAGKNLTFSLALFPNYLPISEQFLLNCSIALGVQKTVHQLLPQKCVQVKWPNDIIVDGKKIAGILIENSLKGKLLKSSIIGIGINVNQKVFSFQSNFPITSLAIETQNEVDLNTVFQMLCENLNYYYEQVQDEKNWEKIKREYLHILLGFAEDRSYLIGETRVRGVIENVNQYGQLEIEISGELQSFNIKEIQFLT